MSGDLDNAAYADDFAARIVRRAGARVAATYEGDDLRAVADLVRSAEDALRVAVAGMRSQGYSWQVIADELGVTRQTAHARFTDGVVCLPESRVRRSS